MEKSDGDRKPEEEEFDDSFDLEEGEDDK